MQGLKSPIRRFRPMKRWKLRAGKVTEIQWHQIVQWWASRLISSTREWLGISVFSSAEKVREGWTLVGLFLEGTAPTLLQKELDRQNKKQWVGMRNDIGVTTRTGHLWGALKNLPYNGTVLSFELVSLWYHYTNDSKRHNSNWVQYCVDNRVCNSPSWTMHVPVLNLKTTPTLGKENRSTMTTKETGWSQSSRTSRWRQASLLALKNFKLKNLLHLSEKECMVEYPYKL